MPSKKPFLEAFFPYSIPIIKKRRSIPIKIMVAVALLYKRLKILNKDNIVENRRSIPINIPIVFPYVFKIFKINHLIQCMHD